MKCNGGVVCATPSGIHKEKNKEEKFNKAKLYFIKKLIFKVI